MRTLIDHLANYAAYHRDRRNIVTHFVGVPMIVLAVAVWLARPVLAWHGLSLTPAWGLAGLSTLFYLRLDLRYGLVMGGLLAVLVVAAHQSTPLAHGAWLATGGGLFVVGWIIQFIGHWLEGRKPALFDDLRGLVIGPLFVVAELGFLLGLRLEVRAACERTSGPVRAGRPRAARQQDIPA